MSDVLKQLQEVQIEILDVIDNICKRNQIKYSLYAGTLLGAARHNGFIPWDDDLDICMLRSEYERFIEAWDKAKPEGYILQNKENTPAFTQSFTKIRKDHTTFLQFDSERNRYHTGIFVDIFPLDRVPESSLKKGIYSFKILYYQLLTREYIPPKSSFPVKAVSYLLLNMTPKAKRMPRREKLLNWITHFKDEKLPLVSISTASSMMNILPNDLMDDLVMLEFDGKEYPCFKNWDRCLTVLYGDYMQLPPESERVWKHHPIILDFKKNFNELLEET